MSKKHVHRDKKKVANRKKYNRVEKIKLWKSGTRIITIAEPVNWTLSTYYGEVSHNFNPQNVSNALLVIYI